MRAFSVSNAFKMTAYLLLTTLTTGWSTTVYAVSPDEATQFVKAQSCRDNQTVEQILDQSVRSHSQRDIGWRTFQEDGYYDIERAVLINKGMELHYRWRVNIDGHINAENERAMKLCTTDS